MGLYHVQNTDTHEHLYEKANLAEANWLMGTECLFTPCLSYTRDIGSDPHPVMGEPISINIVFDDNPKSTLEKRNWLAEGEELPYLAYISSINYPKFKKFKSDAKESGQNLKQLFDRSFNPDGTPKDNVDFMISVSKFAMVELPYKMEVAGTQKFRVTDVQGDSVNPFIWLCKLAPHRDQIDVNPDTPEIDDKLSNDKDQAITGNIYLNIGKKP